MDDPLGEIMGTQVAVVMVDDNITVKHYFSACFPDPVAQFAVLTCFQPFMKKADTFHGPPGNNKVAGMKIETVPACGDLFGKSEVAGYK